MMQTSTLNGNILSGHWTELKGALKKQWGLLTNDDLLAAQGDMQKLNGALQARYGYAQADAQARLEAFLRHWELNIKPDEKSMLDELRDSVDNVANQAQSAALQAGTQVDQSVKRNRWLVAISTLLLGIGIGYFAREI